jgi:branched-chain amino acid transport system substrate-binding protein
MSFLEGDTMNNTLLVAIVLGVCMTSAPVLAANITFTCGVILPLSGDAGASGTDVLNGIQLAADRINMNGGAAGYLIDLRIADDQGDPQRALSLFQEMVTDGIPVVIGSKTTNLTLPMAEMTKDTPGTVLISPRANGENLYGISPQFYQVNPPIFSLAKFISKWLEYTSDRVAVMYVDDEYGESFLKNIRAGLTNSSVQITGAEPVTRDTDYSALSERVISNAPDTVVVCLYDSRQIPILVNLSTAGYRGQVVLTESLFIDTLETEISDIISKFSLFTISSNSYLVPGSRSDDFVASYTKKYKKDPSRSTAGYGYDSMMLIADAIRLGSEDGNISAETIQKGLDASCYYGVSGPKVFDSHHAVITAMDRRVFKNGKFELMETSLA